MVAIKAPVMTTRESRRRIARTGGLADMVGMEDGLSANHHLGASVKRPIPHRAGDCQHRAGRRPKDARTRLDHSPAAELTFAMPSPRAEQPLPIRLAHWINVPLLLLMAGSGLQILAAFPEMGPKGAPYGWYPFHGVAPPRWMTAGSWLAGGRHLHFALAWFLVLNALVYLGYLVASGEWRRRVFLFRRDARNALQ